MDCTTIRRDTECPFMASSGCSYNGGVCHEVNEKCYGCSRSKEYSSRWYCIAYPDPSLKWKNGDCNLASHVVSESTVKKTKINPLKASKRGKE